MASFNRAVVNYTVANSKSFPFLGAVQDSISLSPKIAILLYAIQ
jgi:hypothetical protein